jgi:hypothetical protein
MNCLVPHQFAIVFQFLLRCSAVRQASACAVSVGFMQHECDMDGYQRLNLPPARCD